MANLREELEDYERQTGETIEAMVVGLHDRKRYSEGSLPDENIVLSREAGLAKVDMEYGAGYGSADCYPLYAWTPSRVYWVAEYDGASGLAWAPRHPVAIDPNFSGQS